MNKERSALTIVIALWCIAAFANGSPIAVTIAGNFGSPIQGTSAFDNQAYSINFTIPDPSAPDATVCCAPGQVEADYNVFATWSVPGLGFSHSDPIIAGYLNQQPLGLWMNLSFFTGLANGDFMLVTPLQVNDPLWNGLAGPVGTPVINLLDHSPGTAIFHFEQPDPGGASVPFAVYQSSLTLTAAAVPEPAPAPFLAGVLIAGYLYRRLSRKVAA